MRDAPHVVLNNAAERTAHDPAVAMAALAGRQHGVVARAQLAELGLGRHEVARLLKRGRMHAIHRGVYAVGYRRLTRAGVWMAAVLAGGDGAVLSHRSAAALWGVRDGSPRTIEITTPKRRRERPGLVVHEVRLPLDEITVHDAIPVTTPARTLLDLGAVLDEHRLARAAERRGASPHEPDLPRRPDGALPRRPGVPRIQRLLDDGRIVETITRSGLERRFLTLLDAESPPRPLVNQALGEIRLDFRWTNERLVVELDGFETHGTRAAFERDRARDRALTAAGWRVARITKRQLDDAPEELAAELRALLNAEAA